MEPWLGYIKEYWRQNNRWANWRPDEDREVGWYGTVDDDQFHYVGDLRTLGVTFTTKRDGITGSASFSSSSGVAIKFKAKASAPGVSFNGLSKAEAGFQVSFSRQAAAVMQSHQSRRTWMDVPRDVRRQIVQLIIKGTWRQDWWYIETVTRAATGLVLLSEGGAASVVVNSSASVPNASAKIGFDVKESNGAVQQYPMNDGWVPEFLPVRVRYSLWDRLKDFIAHTGGHQALRLEALADLATLRARGDLGIGLNDELLDALFTSDPIESLDPEGDLVGAGGTRYHAK